MVSLSCFPFFPFPSHNFFRARPLNEGTMTVQALSLPVMDVAFVDDLLCCPLREGKTPVHGETVVDDESVETLVVVSAEEEDVWGMREYWCEEDDAEEEADDSEEGSEEDYVLEDMEEESDYQKMLRMLDEESFFFKQHANANANAIVGTHRTTPMQLHAESTEELHFCCLREELVEELL